MLGVLRGATCIPGGLAPPKTCSPGACSLDRFPQNLALGNLPSLLGSGGFTFRGYCEDGVLSF